MDANPQDSAHENLHRSAYPLGRKALLLTLLVASLALVILHNAGATPQPTPDTAKPTDEAPLDLSRAPRATDAAALATTNPIQLCQVLTPADPNPVPAVDCVRHCPPGYEATWNAMGPISDFQEWAQGEYVGRARLPHVPVYRLRVDDQMQFVFRVTRSESTTPYKLNVGDEMTVESTNDTALQRSLVVLPDGTITLPLIGQVRAAGLTVAQLREDLEKKFEKYYNLPGITITPTKVDTRLEDLRYTVSGRSGFGGQVLQGRVTPEGTIQLPAVGSVPAQGLTLDEFQSELAARFAEKIEGIEVIPVLAQRAPRYVYVLGEVANPGRFSLEQPTTVMQAIAMAGSWNVGAHITHIVVFRRVDDWRLVATMLDLRPALLGHTPCPASEIWVGDNDLVIVPKSKLLRTDNFIELIFTRGLYGVIPFNGGVNYTVFRGLTPLP
ncbi:MAG: polysaccharide biosynthesis/export family protein [Pirellulales bacterium]